VVGQLVFKYLKSSQSQDVQGVDLIKFQSSAGQLLAQSIDFRLADFYFNVFAAEKSEMTKSSQVMLSNVYLNTGISMPRMVIYV